MIKQHHHDPEQRQQHEDDRRRAEEEKHRQQYHRVCHDFQRVVPMRGGDVKLTIHVVHGMDSPQQRHAVIKAVQPIGNAFNQ